MAEMSRLVIVGADKGGVGKTTVARLLLSYCDARKIAYRAVDTEPGENSLRRFYAAAEPIDIAKVAGQMRVFDALAKARLTIVDIRAGLLSNALKAMAHAEVFTEVNEGRMALTILHVVDANVASLEEMAAIAAQLADCEKALHIVVKNQVGEDRFDGADADAYRGYFKHLGVEGIIEVPHLDDIAAKAVDREGVPFGEFARSKDGRSAWLSKLVKVWLDQMWGQFDNAVAPSLKD